MPNKYINCENCKRELNKYEHGIKLIDKHEYIVCPYCHRWNKL